MTSSARSAATQAGNHPIVEHGARLGYAASGMLHLLLGWVSVQLALGSYSGEASESGALKTLAGSSLGAVLLWIAVVGFAVLALWLITEVFVRHETGARVKAGGKAVVYLVLAWTAFNVASAGASGGGGGGQGMTASLMESTAGRLLVGAVGIGVVITGGYHVVKGWTSKFLQDLDAHPGPWTVRAGRFGYVAKGLALGLVGALLLSAAMNADPAQPQGLDAALSTVLQLPIGQVLLVLVGLGFAAYGVYSLVRARHGRV